MERAVDWLFSHASDAPVDVDGSSPADGNPAGLSDTAHSQYELCAFIAHTGSSIHCGHYVAYVKRADKWVLFNDNKVGELSKAPVGSGYIYFFRRLDE